MLRCSAEMKKGDRIASFVRDLGMDGTVALDPCYQAYLRVSTPSYYESHDVLEHLCFSAVTKSFVFQG